MQLPLDGEPRQFEPLADFRARYTLPAAFGVAAFQPKDWDGLGSIDGAADALRRVREQTVRAVPTDVPAAGWLDAIPRLATSFEGALRDANDEIGLRDAEIAFAVSGFGDVCSAYGLALFEAQARRQPSPAFDDVYRRWLFGTVRTGAEAPPYDHNGTTWRVWVVYHAYGRVGLRVHTAGGVHYVVDKSLACPAEGFMVRLLRAATAAMAANTR